MGDRALHGTRGSTTLDSTKEIASQVQTKKRLNEMSMAAVTPKRGKQVKISSMEPEIQQIEGLFMDDTLEDESPDDSSQSEETLNESEAKTVPPPKPILSQKEHDWRMQLLLMAQFKDNQRERERLMELQKQSYNLFKNNEVCIFPSKDIQIFDGLPRIDILNSHLKYTRTKKNSQGNMMKSNKKFTDFMTDFTHLQMLQYKGMKAKNEGNATIDYSQSVQNPVTGLRSPEETQSDGMLDFIDKAEEDQRTP